MKVGELTLEALDTKKGVKLTMGKTSCDVTYKELWAALFVIGDADMQAEIMPVRKTEMMVFARKHTIQASRDIKSGELINVHCEVNIPEILVNSIAEENGAKVIRPSIPDEKGELSPYVPKEEPVL